MAAYGEATGERLGDFDSTALATTVWGYGTLRPPPPERTQWALARLHARATEVYSSPHALQSLRLAPTCVSGPFRQQ